VSVGLFVCSVSCGKNGLLILMLFGILGLLGPRMCSVSGCADYPTGTGNFGDGYGTAHITSGEFLTLLFENVQSD